MKLIKIKRLLKDQLKTDSSTGKLVFDTTKTYEDIYINPAHVVGIGVKANGDTYLEMVNSRSILTEEPVLGLRARLETYRDGYE